MSSMLETAVFGGGCFWCTEAIFQRVRGVHSVTPGYAGGKMVNPSYEKVSMGTTGHAEVIKIEFDPQLISYEDLVTLFFDVHDPTTKDQQGADVGPQYRSIILTTTEEQTQQAMKIKEQLEHDHVYHASITTEILPLNQFYTAEEYHKNYFVENKEQPYCQFVIAPKVKKFLERHAAIAKQDPVV